ncbi:MAG: hypothetical protein ACRDO7_15605 [Nocardioidaceae bacterium]
MSRWGFAALVAALVAVIAIGIGAIRVSDRSTVVRADPPIATPPTDAASSTRASDDRSERRGASVVAKQRRMERKPIGRQLRWLKRELDSAGRLDDVEEFFVTLSLRTPIPLAIVNGRRSPLPDGLSDATLYTLYAEQRDGTPARVQTHDPGDTDSFESFAAANRLVVLGISLPIGEYRALRSDLRSLPVESRVVGPSAHQADYVPDAAYGARALRSWERFYRTS